MTTRTDNLRATVMAALEQACRDGYMDHRNFTSDAQAVNWAPYSGDLRRHMSKAGILFRYQQVRRILAEEVAAGRVLRASPHSNVVRFWPVGLLDKIVAERAAATAKPVIGYTLEQLEGGAV